MIDPQCLLAHEPQQGVGVALQEDLRGDVPTATVVPGAPDGARSTSTDRVDQFVPAREDLTHRCARPPSSSVAVGVLVDRRPSSVVCRDSVLVRLVVRHRVGGATRSVHPEELCQFRMAGGEGLRRVDDVPGRRDRAQQRLDLTDDPLDGGRARTGRRLAAVAEDGSPWVFLISSIRSVASAALTLPSATWPARSWRAWTRWTTAGLPILARWPLISWDSIGAESPRTAARRAWFKPRSSMSRRKSAPNGSPYQLR